eukprot:654884-Prymnesium_polylepis.1
MRSASMKNRMCKKTGRCASDNSDGWSFVVGPSKSRKTKNARELSPPPATCSSTLTCPGELPPDGDLPSPVKRGRKQNAPAMTHLPQAGNGRCVAVCGGGALDSSAELSDGGALANDWAIRRTLRSMGSGVMLAATIDHDSNGVDDCNRTAALCKAATALRRAVVVAALAAAALLAAAAAADLAAALAP